MLSGTSEAVKNTRNSTLLYKLEKFLSETFPLLGINSSYSVDDSKIFGLYCRKFSPYCRLWKGYSDKIFPLVEDSALSELVALPNVEVEIVTASPKYVKKNVMEWLSQNYPSLDNVKKVFVDQGENKFGMYDVLIDDSARLRKKYSPKTQRDLIYIGRSKRDCSFISRPLSPN